MPEPALRRGTSEDLARINEIYNHYVRETPATFHIEAITAEERQAWFEDFDETGRYQLFVAEEGGVVMGFAYSARFRPKEAYEPTVEVTIYIDEKATGRGLGTRLYEALFEALEKEDVHRIYAGITQPNPESMALHERFGFKEIGVYHEVGRKFGRYWDVTWFEKALE